jgi:TatD DNase family protein
MLAMLREHAAETKILLHSYLSGPDYVEKFLELGCFFGIGGPITFKGKKADPHRAAIQLIPMERILLETDAPYLTPHPHRGSRNEPAFTRITAEKIAELKALSLEEVAQQTTTNATAFFAL